MAVRALFGRASGGEQILLTGVVALYRQSLQLGRALRGEPQLLDRN